MALRQLAVAHEYMDQGSLRLLRPPVHESMDPPEDTDDGDQRSTDFHVQGHPSSTIAFINSSLSRGTWLGRRPRLLGQPPRAPLITRGAGCESTRERLRSQSPLSSAEDTPRCCQVLVLVLVRVEEQAHEEVSSGQLTPVSIVRVVGTEYSVADEASPWLLGIIHATSRTTSRARPGRHENKLWTHLSSRCLISGALSALFR